MYKLHVSANSGHHQFYYRFKRKSYIWVGVLIKRSLVSIFLVISGVVTVPMTLLRCVAVPKNQLNVFTAPMIPDRCWSVKAVCA